MNDGIRCVENNGPQDQAKQVVQQIYKGSSFTILVGSNCGDQYWTGSSNADTKNDRKCTCKGKDSGYGKCLEHTDGSGCTLEHCGKRNTYQDTCNGVGKHCQHIDKYRTLTQRRNSSTHHLHSIHQNGKAQHNISDISVYGSLTECTKNNTDHSYDC